MTSAVGASAYIYQVSEIYDDKRTPLGKVADRCLSLLREAFYVCSMLQGRAIDYFNPRFDFAEKEKSWLAESEGLYVLIHGLQGHPVIWQSHIDQLKQNTSKDLFVPYVPQRGNGPLDEVADPILKVIQDYATKRPGKPICLIGVSNGGRICTWLETELRSSHPSTPIKVSTIAAVHFGSRVMNYVKCLYEWTGWSLGHDLSVVDDLCFGSEKAKEILNKVSKPLEEGVIREFEFFASTEDLHVPEIVSSLPKLGVHHKANKRVYNGYAHSGIVAGVAGEQIASCEKWMNSSSHSTTWGCVISESLSHVYQGFLLRTDSAFREQQDHRYLIRKIIDFSISLFRHIPFSLTFLYNLRYLSTSWCSELNVEKKSDNKGLVVLIHGLRSDPVAWYCQLGILKCEKIDVYAPKVTKRGLCSLEQAAKPILESLVNYTKQNPGKPLCLLGHSNGSRIATWLELQLRNLAPKTPVKVSTIAGVHLGSSQMDRLEAVGLAGFYPEELRQELKYGSEKAKELLSQLSSDLPDGCAERDYEFFAATEDLSVPDLDSSVPCKKERFRVLHGHSHDSIVTAVAQEQIDSCIFWIDKKKAIDDSI